jgi:hypothetical protein
MKTIRKNFEEIAGIVEEDIHLNGNLLKNECSFKDPEVTF